MARIPDVDFSSSGRYGWEPSVAPDVLFSSVPQALAARSISVSRVSPSFARAVPMQAKDGKGGTSVRTITAK
jgi:hypothetical protein